MDNKQEGSEEFGVCDECGESTQELVLIEASWLCTECSRMAFPK